MIQVKTLKTKSFWTGVAAIAGGISLICAGDTAGGIQAIAGGVITIVMRDAITKVQQGR